MTTTWRDRYIRSRYIIQKPIRDYNEKPALSAYLEIFLTMAAISLFGIFAIRPTIITIGKLLQEIKAKEQTINTMKEKINNLNAARDLYNRESDKIDLVSEAIPKEPQPDILALQLQELSMSDNISLHGMTIEDAKILGEISPDDDKTLTFSLNLSGDFFSLVKFGEDIENLRRPVKFDRIQISSTRIGEVSTLNMSFENLHTPYY